MHSGAAEIKLKELIKTGFGCLHLWIRSLEWFFDLGVKIIVRENLGIEDVDEENIDEDTQRLDTTQDMSLDMTQDMSFDISQDMSFESSQDLDSTVESQDMNVTGLSKKEQMRILSQQNKRERQKRKRSREKES